MCNLTPRSMSKVKKAAFATVYHQGGTLIFSHIHRLGLFFGVQNSEFQHFWGGFRKMNIFGGMKILRIIFRGNHKIGLV